MPRRADLRASIYPNDYRVTEIGDIAHMLKTSYFAILESFAAQLAKGPEARVQLPRATRPPGAVGIFGVLGSSSDWFADSSYESIRADVGRALANPQARAIDLYIDSPGGSVLGLPETADVIHAANRVKPVRAFV